MRVSPRSPGTGVLGTLEDGSVRISLRAPPSGGAANRELIRFLSDEFGTDRSSVTVVTGGSRRRKLVRIESPTRTPPWYPAGTADGIPQR